eukprot:gene31788-42398_t
MKVGPALRWWLRKPSKRPSKPGLRSAAPSLEFLADCSGRGFFLLPLPLPLPLPSTWPPPPPWLLVLFPPSLSLSPPLSLPLSLSLSLSLSRPPLPSASVAGASERMAETMGRAVASLDESQRAAKRPAAARQSTATALRDRLKDPSLLRDKCYIDGAWIGTGATPVTNPVDDVELARVPNMGTKEATQAVEAASRAFPLWAKFTAKQRSNILRKWFELIIANREDLALILTTEQGKPLAEALGEVDIGAAYIEFFAEEARRVYGETIPTQRADARLLTLTARSMANWPLLIHSTIATATTEGGGNSTMLTMCDLNIVDSVVLRRLGAGFAFPHRQHRAVSAAFGGRS